MAFARYAWIIDKDHIADPTATPGTLCNAIGLVGPSAVNPELEKELADGKGTAFKMYDDDNELYYEGRIIYENQIADARSFKPLDDFGMPNAGAVTIKYLEGGQWLTL